MATHLSFFTKRLISRILLLSIFSTSFFTSCRVDDVGNYYTFTGLTVGQYLKEDPDAIGTSEYYGILETTNVLGLLNAYGEYTCFVPTDDAMKKLYAQKGDPHFHQNFSACFNE